MIKLWVIELVFILLVLVFLVWAIHYYIKTTQEHERKMECIERELDELRKRIDRF